MNTIKYILSLVFICLLFASCEEVIDLKLHTADEKYIIEANLSNQEGGARVAISKTKSFNASGNFNGESGAVVNIEDGLGNTYRLTESAVKGIYTHPSLKGLPENTYKLKVEINGQTFTASSKMPVLVKLDSVYALDLKVFDGTRKFTHVQFRDPAGKGNCYRFIEYRNNVYTKVITVANDDYFDGNLVNQIVPPKEFNDESKLVAGDVMKIEFLTIATPVYKYWYSVDNGAQGGSDSAAPVNPVSNIVGGAMGYFSAHTLQSKSYTIK